MTTLPLQKSSTTGWWTQDPLLERTIVPFRMLEDTMMDPFRRERMLPFENMMMRPFDNNTHNRTLGTLTNVFKTDVVEHPTAFCLQADLPGIKKTDINVAIEGDFLCIRAERKWEHDETTARLHRTEREFGKVERSFRIPENVDKEKLTASFENGVLKMWLPKCNTDKTAEAVRIPITDENEKFQFSKN